MNVRSDLSALQAERDAERKREDDNFYSLMKTVIICTTGIFFAIYALLIRLVIRCT